MSGSGSLGSQTTYRILVLANAVPGREAEFDRWYTQQHIPQILATPGFRSAQRFALASSQVTPEPGPHRYFTIYEVQTQDIRAVLEHLAMRRGAGEITRSDALAADAIAYVLEASTAVIVAPERVGRQGDA